MKRREIDIAKPLNFETQSIVSDNFRNLNQLQNMKTMHGKGDLLPLFLFFGVSYECNFNNQKEPQKIGSKEFVVKGSCEHELLINPVTGTVFKEGDTCSQDKFR